MVAKHTGELRDQLAPRWVETRVLAHRIAYLIRERQVPPHRILAVTFTNKAAGEMADRIQKLVGVGASAISIGTFHAICGRILRRDGASIGIPSNFVIYDDTDQLGIIRQALKDLNLDDKYYPPRSVQAAISAAKSLLIEPAAYAEQVKSYREEIIARIYRRYQEILGQCNAVDFDDMIMSTVRLLQSDQAVREKYQERYLHNLVDEYQDTNHAQYVLVTLLADKHRNLCVVGDPDQSIYGWRQADIRNILEFERDYPDARVVLLEQNYRSTQNVLDTAQAVILANQQRKERRLWTENPNGEQITLFEAYNEQEEAQYVVREIDRLARQNIASARECAVMYRTNALSRPLEEAFIRFGMPYQLVGATRFYERREVKDVLAYLRLVHNPRDNASLSRIIGTTPAGRGIGEKTMGAIEASAHRLGISTFEALTMVARDQLESSNALALPPRTRRLLADFASLIESLVNATERLTLVELLDLVLERSGYAAYVNDGTEEGRERWENVKELRTVARKHDELAPTQALASFLEEVALISDVDTMDDRRDGATLITLHASKGLEFRVVFIVGLEEGLLPHARSVDQPHELEEERRLSYVGMTRAKERLYLSYCFRRTLYGNSNVSAPSRFLADIPPHLIKGRETAAQAASTASRPPAPRPPGSSPAAARTAPVTLSYRDGERVRHGSFGEGIVVSSKVVPGDEEVTVAFAGHGVKRLMASFARLERVE